MGNNLRSMGLGFAPTCGAILAVSAALVSSGNSNQAVQSTRPRSSANAVRYTDIRQSAGITFRQDGTQTEEKYYLETMGTGVAWIDYDQDGLMDLFFVQSAATDIYKPPSPLRSALYHNNGDGTFTDVTEIAGVGGKDHYGQGVAVADFDNDGYPDLYVTGYGRAILYHNNGNGTFTDVTAKAGVADEGGWSTSAGWFDYDKDGWLDLVVTNYIEWTPKNNLWCGEHRPGYRSYCHPGNYKGQRIKLYHNNRDGTFTDVSDASGVGKPEAKGMGVVLADFNNDGWPDIAVANDSWPNFLFINKHDGTFEDVSLVSGIAASEDGRYEAGMGIDTADVDGDGWPDILQLNGAMLDNIQLYHTEVTYKEPLLMFRNLGKGQFEKVSHLLGPDFVRPIAGRGVATADYDNDGDMDIVTNNRGDYPSLLRNDGGNVNHWLTVLLIGTKSNRDGIGASLKMSSEGFMHVEQAKNGMGYMSASDPRIHFGLGQRTKVDSLEITWPSGQVDRVTNVPIDRIIAVKEGTGVVPREFPKIASTK